MKQPFATLYTPKDFRLSPWKNGRGTTAEIAAEPAGAGWEDFLWRLSSAQISEAGPFSEFPGYDRFLTLVEGPELKLAGAGGKARLRPGDVHHFSGDETTHAEIVGPVRDLGLLYRRGKVKAEMRVLDFAGSRSFRMDAAATFFFALFGSFQVSCYPGESRFNLTAGSALRLVTQAEDPERVVLLEPNAPGAQLVAVELSW